MIVPLAFVLAATAGTLARAEAGRRWNRHEGMPWGTLAVNVLGSTVLGLLHEATPTTVTVLGVGGLGAFTTYSSFARDVAALGELRRLALAVGYVVATCAAGVGGAWLAMAS